VRLTFSPRLVTEPVIHQLGSRFAVVTNIRRADVTRDEGWVVLEVEGEPDDVVAWIREQETRAGGSRGSGATGRDR
jgi:hypothetical protein